MSYFFWGVGVGLFVFGGSLHLPDWLRIGLFLISMAFFIYVAFTSLEKLKNQIK